MGGVVMRDWSNRYLTAVLSGLTVTVLLLSAIRARNEGLAEKRVIAVSEQARTHASANGDRVVLDMGVADLRGSLP